MSPEYLKDVMGGEDTVDLFNRSLELTRKARALKLWLTFQTHGLRRDCCGACKPGWTSRCEHKRWCRRSRTRGELVTPAKLGILTFARRGAGAQDRERLVAQLSRRKARLRSQSAAHPWGVLSCACAR
jgi:hypothetical protein